MNFVGFAKIANYLALALLLAGLSLTGCKRADSVDASKRSATTVESLQQDQPEVRDDQSTALAAYQKAVELDPDNTEGWNQLGALLLRTGELAQAEQAWNKMLALSQAHQDKEDQAKALGNLGLVYKTRGELDRAEEMYRKSLEIEEALGRKEGLATNYANLGIVYKKRGDLGKAEELWKKSLRLYEEIGMSDSKKIQQWLNKLAEQRSAATQ